MQITVNGTSYGSWDDMPEGVRAQLRHPCPTRIPTGEASAKRHWWSRG